MAVRRSLALALPALAACGAQSGTATPAPSAGVGAAPPRGSAMTLTSADLRDGGTVPPVHVYDAAGCTGGNLSPALAWSGAPAATRSYAVTVHDPDAPAAGGFWHWVVYDIPASVAALPRGAGSAGTSRLPPGTRQARSDFGDAAYDGPCPPAGPPHRYDLTVSALDVGSLNLPPGASPAQVSFQLRTHTLASARLTVRYGR